MSTLLLQLPSTTTTPTPTPRSTPTPTLQRLNSRDMLRSLPSDEAAQAIDYKTQQHTPKTNNDTNASTHWLAPPLAPKVLAPLRHSKAADAAVQLHRIQYVEVSDVVHHADNSTDYYVIDVYLKKEQSRIPTNQSRFQRTLQPHASHHRRTPLGARTAPDFTVHRRFSDFEKLRKAMWATVQQPHRHYCSFCDGFMYMLLFSSAQPGMLAKTVFKSTEVRAKLLDKFLHNVVDQFQRNRPRCRLACHALDHLPLLLAQFLMGGEIAGDDDDDSENEQRRSDASVASAGSNDPTHDAWR